VVQRLFLLVVLALSASAVACGGSKSASEEECRVALTPYLATLKNLDSRLSVSVTYSDYGERVGDIAVAHDNVQSDDTWSDDCTAARSAADGAFADYKRAGEIWTACLKRLPPPYGRGPCPENSPRRQALWLAAREKVTRADSLLNPPAE
jgi:hypothetical protein